MRAVGRAAPRDHCRCLGKLETIDDLVNRVARLAFGMRKVHDDALGMVLDAETDRVEVRELMIESFCVLAPKKLIALVDRPGPRWLARIRSASRRRTGERGSPSDTPDGRSATGRAAGHAGSYSPAGPASGPFTQTRRMSTMPAI